MKYNNIYQNTTSSILTDKYLSFAKKDFNQYSRKLPEIMVLHLFLTKKDVKKSMEKSFSNITSDRKLIEAKMYPKLPQFNAVRSALILTIIAKECKYNLRGFSEPSLLSIHEEIRNSLCFYSRDMGEDFSNKSSQFSNYLYEQHLTKSEFDQLISKLSSYFLYLYSDYVNFVKPKKEIHIYPYNIIRDKKMNNVYNLYNLIFKSKKRNIEQNIIKGYNKNNNNLDIKSNNASLVYFYQKNKRIYKEIIWEKEKKPKNFNFHEKFYNSLNGLFSKFYKFDYFKFKEFDNIASSENAILVMLSIEQIFNFRLKLNNEIMKK